MQSSSKQKPTSEGSSPSHGLLSRSLIGRLRQLDPARRSPHGSESGQAIVEFALILPLLLIFLLLILDFGRGINYWIDTTHLASEGARLAAVGKVPDGASSLQAYIKDEADTEELRSGAGGVFGVQGTGLKVCIEYPDGSQEVGDPVKLVLSADYDWMPLLSAEFGIGQTTILGSATHRIERVNYAIKDTCVS